MATKQRGEIVETTTEARQAEAGPSVLLLLVISSFLPASGTRSFAPDGTGRPALRLLCLNLPPLAET
jgi:hypothetical protein